MAERVKELENKVDTMHNGSGSSNTQQATYFVEKIGSTVYGRPSSVSGLPSFSGTDFTVVIDSAMNRMPNGGIVLIGQGSFTNVSSIIIPYPHITIRGAGQYLTKIQLKASADVGTTLFGLIDAGAVDSTIIQDLELDGNKANQTKIDNGSTQTSISNGIMSRNFSKNSSFTLVDNCYVHDFTQCGILFYSSDDGIIRDCRVENNNWNNISISVYSSRNHVYNCQTAGCADVSISLSGTENTAENCLIKDVTGVNGSDNSRWGIGMEGQGSEANATRCAAINNIITGDSLRFAIRLNDSTIDCRVVGNTIRDLTFLNAVAIQVAGGTYTKISGNKILRQNGQGIVLNGAQFSVVSDNDMSQSTRWYGIGLDLNADNNRITGNTIMSRYGLVITSGSDNNTIIGNYLKGTATGQDYQNSGSNNIAQSNFAGFDQVLIDDDRNFARTALTALGSAILAEPITGNISNANTAATLADQQIRFILVYLPKSATITGVKFYQQTNGSYTANNYNGIGLYSLNTSNGVLTFIDQTANDGTLWQSGTGMHNKAFGTTHVLNAGWYGVAFLYCRSAETTAPNIEAYPAPGSSTIEAVDFGNSIKLNSSLATQTALPATTQAMSGLSNLGANHWVGLY